MKVVEYRGARNLVYAPITEDSDENFTTGTVKPFAGVAEISKSSESSSETHYYDNAPMVVVSSIGADTVTLTVSAIPYDVLADANGQYYDAAKGMYVESELKTVYFAIGYITENTDGEEIYVWRLKGTFSVPDEDNKTKDNTTDANGQEIIFTGVKTKHKFTANDDGAKAVYVNTAINTSVEEDTFFATVATPDTVPTPL